MINVGLKSKVAKRGHKILSIVLIVLVAFGCNSQQHAVNKDDISHDLKDILASGKLVAVSGFNSTGYFIYKGEPMGYQYDLLRDFASSLGVKLELVAENDVEKAQAMLERGEVDLIANGLTITAERRNVYSFTKPIGQTRQVLVQRRASTPDAPEHVSSTLELAGRIVYVQQRSASEMRLRHVAEEIGEDIKVVPLPGVDADRLMELVASGEIDYAVCDEIAAKVKGETLPQLDCTVPVSFMQNLAWAVRPSSPKLLERINEWLDGYLPTAHHRLLKHRYFDSPSQRRNMNSDYFYVTEGRVSQWDEYFKQSSLKIDWDWRLVASMVYQESRFKANAVSPRGASGLMQLMPSTADYFGLDEDASPRLQIDAGVRYLRILDRKLAREGVPEHDRKKFVLAAYNAGFGHVLDAIKLAQKYGRNPNVWDGNVEYFIAHKSEYANDPVVKHGRLGGVETLNYVREIMERYQHYCNIVMQ